MGKTKRTGKNSESKNKRKKTLAIRVVLRVSFGVEFVNEVKLCYNLFILHSVIPDLGPESKPLDQNRVI